MQAKGELWVADISGHLKLFFLHAALNPQFHPSRPRAATFFPAVPSAEHTSWTRQKQSDVNTSAPADAALQGSGVGQVALRWMRIREAQRSAICLMQQEPAT
jgi:hypothetical protein